MGIQKSDILITDSVKNTLDESLKVKELILNNSKSFKNKRIILVTSAFHMNRSILLFNRQGFEITPFPVDFQKKEFNFSKLIRNPHNLIPTSENLYISSKAIKEILGKTFYYIKYSI